MALQKYEDLLVRQKSHDFAISIFKSFSGLKDCFYKDQIFRASVSISNNIAEGFERSSNPDFKRFLYFSLASNSELRSMLYLAKRLNYIDSALALEMKNETNEMSKMLYSFIKSMK